MAHMLMEAQGEREPIDANRMTKDANEKGALLFNILVQVCGGRALAILTNVPGGRRLMCKEFEPESRARTAAMLTGLLAPKRDENASFSEQWRGLGSQRNDERSL